MTRWAVRMPRASASSLGALRLLPGIEAALGGDEIWLRGETLREGDELQLRLLPGAERYSVDDEGALVPAEHRVPAGWLPNAPWLPLREFLRVTLPLTPLPPSAVARQLLTLAADTAERPIAAILTSIGLWSAYADSAPLVRLSRLSFLTCSDGGVLIVGTPLPSLTGQRYWESEGMFVAAGRSWQPAVDAQLVRRALGLAGGELAIWHADGSWERGRRDDLVAARRSSVRATVEGLADAHR